MRVGCFEVSQTEPGKWKVVNTLTGFVHYTFGTKEEIMPILNHQSTLWEARSNKFEAPMYSKRPGGPYRPTIAKPKTG